MNAQKSTRGKVTAWGIVHQCDMCLKIAKFRWTRGPEVFAAACPEHRDEVKRALYAKYAKTVRS